MAATISDPFHLASYPTAARSTLPTVFASHTPASSSADGYATVAAQGSGVHVLDISSLRPVISHTLGPGTTFACPAVSHTAVDGAARVCTTYAVVAASPDVPAEERGRTVWAWREDLAGSLADRAAQTKQSAVMPHTVARIYATGAHVVLISSAGHVTVATGDLTIRSTRAGSGTLLHAFVFPGGSCTFAPRSAASVVVLLLSAQNGVRVLVLGVGEDDDIAELGDSEIALQKISAASCSASGFLSIITPTADWHAYQLESPAAGAPLVAVPTADPLRLASLSFPRSARELALLALTSSHVLLAAVPAAPASPRTLALLLWDLRFAALFAAHTLPVPAALGTAPLALTLSPAGPAAALLVLAPAGRGGAGAPTSVLVAPLSVPAASTIANAMGRAAAGAPWLAGAPAPALDGAHAGLLATMRAAAAKNRHQDAAAAFLRWAGGAADGKGKARESGPGLSQAFVVALLEVVLVPAAGADTRVLHYLLERGAVSAAMVPGGLIAALRARNDWVSIALALTTVRDIPEDDLASALQHVVAHHRAHADAAADAMRVDSAVPALGAFLAPCVAFAASAPALRAALRRHLPDAADVRAVLAVLDAWVAQWAARDARLLPPKKALVRDAAGALVAPAPAPADTAGVPPALADIVLFLQRLLDAAHLALLADARAAPLLQRLAARVEGAAARGDALAGLCAPLEPFVRAQAQARAGAGAGRKAAAGDWRQRRRAAHETAGGAVGAYRLEELVL